MKLSIIIPTFNEAENIVATLTPLQALRQQGHEVIIVDGNSSDDTFSLATEFSDQTIISQRGRATQMNTAAKQANGDVLLFLHADTFLPAEADSLIKKGIDQNHRWGRFNVKLSGNQPLLRIIEFFMNLRSRLTGIATGDQAIFIDKKLFVAINGFPDIGLMEDIAICKRLKRVSKPRCLKQQVTTSSRRWENNGILRTTLLMWRLRLAYFLGINPQRLANHYHKA